jgi:hypothetical protein
MGRPIATTGLIHTNPGSDPSRMPRQQGWLQQGPLAERLSVAEMYLKLVLRYPLEEKKVASDLEGATKLDQERVFHLN